jgi:hypothetical protein
MTLLPDEFNPLHFISNHLFFSIVFIQLQSSSFSFKRFLLFGEAIEIDFI